MRLLVVSPIPVHTDASGQRWSMDLWVTDIAANARQVPLLTVLAPRGSAKGPSDARWPAGIAVVHVDEVRGRDAALSALIARHDIVSVGSGRPRWHMQHELRVAAATRRAGKKLVLSVSSNRAATTVMNARGQNIVKRAKARMIAASLLGVTQAMAAKSDAVMVVGEGVAQAMGLDGHPHLQVETASWIDTSLIVDDTAFEQRCEATRQREGPATACFAGRLEPMKGAHVGVDALAQVMRSDARACLSVFGQGPALADLQQQAARLAADVRFEGTRAYPHAFLQAIAAFDLVLMTNLNDEQPRLVFDAISQGVIPLCPNTRTYRALGLPDAVYFERGDARALAAAWARFHDASLRLATMRALRPLAFEFTIDAMHRRRAAWMRALVAA